MRCVAIIVAGGSGVRMQSNINKVLMKVDGEVLIVKSVRAFMDMDDIVLVVRAGDKDEIVTALQNANISLARIRFVEGGITRGDSVQNGLCAIDNCDYVLIHDAARPFVKKTDIQNLLLDAEKYGAAILASPVNDTLKKSDEDGFIHHTIDRERVYYAQTPQAFRFELLQRAYQTARERNMQATDDAALLEALGLPVKITVGSKKNYKITRQEDLPMEQFRIGHGFDVHRLVEGRKLILCGVEIPFEKGLLGHSDADVATHTLMDAMLGALALGDIGRHFPDTDEQYRGADSIKLLEEVNRMIQQKGYRLFQADITIIAQSPKMALFIQSMRERLAKTLHMDIEYINIKASTTEKLGFCGRGEGIACEAVCMVKSLEV